MAFKVSVSTTGKLGLIALSNLVKEIFTTHAKREIFDIATVVGDTISLTNTPNLFSEVVVVDGLIMTEGVNYDYVLANNVITFNINVLPIDGHILVNYIS